MSKDRIRKKTLIQRRVLESLVNLVTLCLIANILLVLLYRTRHFRDAEIERGDKRSAQEIGSTTGQAGALCVAYWTS